VFNKKNYGSDGEILEVVLSGKQWKSSQSLVYQNGFQSHNVENG
jgi:hypothetical protein